VERSGGVWRFGDGGKKKRKKFVIAQKKRNSESDHGSFLDSSGVTKNKNGVIHMIRRFLRFFSFFQSIVANNLKECSKIKQL